MVGDMVRIVRISHRVGGRWVVFAWLWVVHWGCSRMVRLVVDVMVGGREYSHVE